MSIDDEEDEIAYGWWCPSWERLSVAGWRWKLALQNNFPDFIFWLFLSSWERNRPEVVLAWRPRAPIAKISLRLFLWTLSLTLTLSSHCKDLTSTFSSNNSGSWHHWCIYSGLRASFHNVMCGPQMILLIFHFFPVFVFSLDSFSFSGEETPTSPPNRRAHGYLKRE